MDGILNSLSEMLKGVDFASLLSTIMEAGKKLFEMLQPLLGSLTSNLGGTTDPTSTTAAA